MAKNTPTPVPANIPVSTKKENLFIKIVRFLFPKKSDKENIVQYIVRQFYMADATGKPSVTTTILFFVMGIVAMIAWTETEIAKHAKQIKQPDGTILSQLQGYSDYFLVMAIGLTIVITHYYRQRSKDSNGDSAAGGIIDVAKDVVSGVVGKITGKQ